MIDDKKWKDRLNYAKRLRHAISVIDKFPDEPPVSKNKDVAEAVAELMRMAEDAACFIELNYFSFKRKPCFGSVYVEGDFKDVRESGMDHAYFDCEKCLAWYAGQEMKDWMRRILVVKCTSVLKDGTTIKYWSGVCAKCESVAVCGEPSERKRIIDAMRQFENRMSDGLMGIYMRGFNEVKQEINDAEPIKSAFDWLLGRE